MSTSPISSSSSMSSSSSSSLASSASSSLPVRIDSTLELFSAEELGLPASLAGSASSSHNSTSSHSTNLVPQLDPREETRTELLVQNHSEYLAGRLFAAIFIHRSYPGKPNDERGAKTRPSVPRIEIVRVSSPIRTHNAFEDSSDDEG